MARSCRSRHSDGLLDGAEPYLRADIDGNDEINGLDDDSNGDAKGDFARTCVVFRPNAVGGDYDEQGVWVAVDPAGPNVEGDGVDLSAASTYFEYESTVSTYAGSPVQVFFGFELDTGEDTNPEDVRTPEGYAVYFEDASPDAVYLVVEEGLAYRFEAATPPGGYDDSPHPIDSHVRLRSETYDWREAINDDQDMDRLRAAKPTTRAGASPAFAVARTVM